MTQEWIAAAFHLRTQFGSEKGKCHPPHQTGLAPTFTIMSYTPTPSLFSTLLRRETCVNLGTFLGAASVHRPPLHRLGEGSAGCRLLGSTDNASARPCDVPRWNLQPTMGPKSPLSSQVPPSRIAFTHLRQGLKLPCTDRQLRGLQTLPPASC